MITNILAAASVPRFHLELSIDRCPLISIDVWLHCPNIVALRLDINFDTLEFTAYQGLWPSTVVVFVLKQPVKELFLCCP